MEIIICDDEEYMLENIKQVCIESLGEEAHTTCYLSSEELMKEINNVKPEVDLFILDIEMPGIDGLELKEIISRVYMDTNILFVTSHDELVYEAFGHKVVGFIPKENYEDKLVKKLREVKDAIADKALIKICINKNMEYTIYTNEIYSIEANREYTTLYRVVDYNLDGGRIELKEELLRIKLKEWQERLREYDFCKVNRSCIVGLRYIKEIDKKLIMDDGRKYSIPEGKKRSLTKIYNEYRRRKFKCL